MAKLTKAQAKLHERAVKLLQCKELSEADTRFIFDHYREDANHINSTAGAFFTPYGLARDFRLHIPLNFKDHVKLIDLCAGIGILSYMAHVPAIIITSAVWKSHALKSIKIM